MNNRRVGKWQQAIVVFYVTTRLNIRAGPRRDSNNRSFLGASPWMNGEVRSSNVLTMTMMIKIAVVALALCPTTAIIHGQAVAFVVMPSRAKLVAISTKKSKVRTILAPRTTTTTTSSGTSRRCSGASRRA